jgi:hypothetical protein
MENTDPGLIQQRMLVDTRDYDYDHTGDSRSDRARND